MSNVPLKLVTRMFSRWLTPTNMELLLSLRASHAGVKVVHGRWTGPSQLLRRYSTVSRYDWPPVTSTDKHTANTPDTRSASLQFILQPTGNHHPNEVYLALSQLNFFVLIKTTKLIKCNSTPYLANIVIM